MVSYGKEKQFCLFPLQNPTHHHSHVDVNKEVLGIEVKFKRNEVTRMIRFYLADVHQNAVRELILSWSVCLCYIMHHAY